MKKIIKILPLWLIVVKMSAQTIPSKEQTLKDVRSVTALTDINHTAVKKYTWEQITLQYKEFANGDNLYDPKFRTEQSDQAKKLGLSYDDLGYIYLVATTPKDADGVYYDCSIRVLYYRSAQNAAWVYKDSRMEPNGYYRRGTEKVNNLAVKEALDQLNNYKGESVNSGKYQIMSNTDLDFVRIDEILKDPKKDDYITSTQKNLYFLVKGTVAGFAMHSDYAELQYYFENALVELTVRYEKESSGKWNFTSAEMAPRIENQGVGPEYSKGFKEIQVGDEEKFAVKRYKTLKIHGFGEVYKKQSTYERNLFTDTDFGLFKNKLQTLGETLFSDVETGKTMLKTMIKPELPNGEEVFNSWVMFFQKAKAYDCEINFSAPGSPSGESFDKSKYTYLVTPGISVNRKSAGKNNELLKKYKSQGMTKETLSKTGGGLYSANPRPYKIEYVKGNWYIKEGLTFESESWD